MPKKKATPKAAVTPAKASSAVPPSKQAPAKRGRAKSVPDQAELDRLMHLPVPKKKPGRTGKKAAVDAEPARRRPPVPIERPESGEETSSSNEESSEEEPSTDDGNEPGDQIEYAEPEDIPRNTNPLGKKGIICIILDYYYYYLYYRI
jgi:hypothetical protein